VTPDQARSVIDAASGVPKYELAILIIVGLSGLLSLVSSVAIALWRGKWREMERKLSIIETTVTENHTLVVGQYVQRPELEKAIERLVEAQREERREVLEALRDIKVGLASKVDQTYCDRWHGMVKP
jgi:sigma54-dependent transcription regulator